MEIRHFKLIKTVTESGTLSKAAEELFLSQPALSHQLKEVEKEVGGAVFQRINKKMIPTQIGKHLYEVSNDILGKVEVSDAKIKKMIKGEDVFIRLSAQCYTFYHWLSAVLLRYKKEYPNVDIKIVSEATFNAANWLEAGKIDLAILNYYDSRKGIKLYDLFEDELVLVTHPSHPLSKRKFVNPKDLSNEHYITYVAEKGCIGKTYQDIFVNNNVTPKKITEVQLTEVILEMVKSNLGVTIMAGWAAKKYITQGNVKAIPVGNKGYTRTWYAATLDIPKMPDYLSFFIKCLYTSKES